MQPDLLLCGDIAIYVATGEETPELKAQLAEEPFVIHEHIALLQGSGFIKEGTRSLHLSELTLQGWDLYEYARRPIYRELHKRIEGEFGTVSLGFLIHVIHSTMQLQMQFTLRNATVFLK